MNRQAIIELLLESDKLERPKILYDWLIANNFEINTNNKYIHLFCRYKDLTIDIWPSTLKMHTTEFKVKKTYNGAHAIINKLTILKEII